MDHKDVLQFVLKIWALCETMVMGVALTLQGSVLSSGSIRFQCQLLNPETCCGQCNASSQAAVFSGGMQNCTQRVGFAWSSSWSFCLMRQNNIITALSNKHISCPTCSEDLHPFPLNVTWPSASAVQCLLFRRRCSRESIHMSNRFEPL